MSQKRHYDNARAQILDAAEQVALQDGILKLTVDNVAKKAQLTKGGVTYHFHSKQDLIAALLLRLGEQMTALFMREYQALPDKQGRFSQAIINHMLGDNPEIEAIFARVSTIFVAAHVHYPQEFTQATAAYQNILKLANHDSLPRDITAIVIATIDGLCMAEMFGIYKYDKPFIRTIRTRLEGLIEHANR
jgi:AcrR family transcriptional regulator